MAFVRIKKHNKEIERLLTDANLSTKVQLFFSYTTWGDDADPYEHNTVDAKLNPKTIKAYVTEVSPQALLYKSYGLHEAGAVEVLCSDKYEEWFLKCAKIVIDNKEYQIFKEAVGGRAIVTHRPFKMIRVVLSRRIQ